MPRRSPRVPQANWKLNWATQTAFWCPGASIRGIEGKIKAAEYARTHKVPYLGICLGMQET